VLRSGREVVRREFDVWSTYHYAAFAEAYRHHKCQPSRINDQQSIHMSDPDP
jgi:hypothetical protein